MNYVSYQQMISDVKDLASMIDVDYDLIVGIPRSGMMVASILALIKQLPVTSVKGFKHSDFKGGERMKDSIKIKDQIKKILLVDDSLWSGDSMLKAQKKIVKISRVGLERIDCACLYSSVNGREKLDYFLKIVPDPRLFEWNLMNNRYLSETCISLEAICGSLELNFKSKPVNIPKKVSVLGIISCISEKYRCSLVDWLDQHQVKYQNLIMVPNEITLIDPIEWKASQIKLLGGSFMIEFDQKDSKRVADLIKIPVICLSNQRVYL